MSRWITYISLGLLIVVLGVMSWVVERAGKPDPPKAPTAEENAAREAAMKERMQQEAASRAKMMESVKAQTSGKKGGVAKDDAKRPVNPTAPPEPPKDGKNKLPAGALDVTGDWHKNRKPGDVGLSILEKEAAEDAPPPQPAPKPAPAARPQ